MLGRGGMGMVYEAELVGSHRHVAIKVMHPESQADGDNVRRFVNEALAAARVRHPNVVEVLDAGEDPDDGSLFIVLELLTGIDLATYLLRYDKLLPGETLTVVCQVLQALIVAHRENIVHRDIKPENVFLARRASGETHVKIVDFGISKILDPEKEISLSITRANTTVGTPHYMSPEQARGEQIDPRADIWALGVVMYECLTGELPFDGENYNQQILAVVTEEHKRATELGIESGLSALIDRCLEKDRSSRFASAADMLQEIGAYLEQHPEIAVRQSLLRIPGPEEFPTARPDDPTTQQEIAPGIGRARDTVEDLTDDAQPAAAEEFAGPLSIRPVFPGMVRIDDENAADSAPTKVHAVKVSAVVEGGAAPVPLSQRPGYQRFDSIRPAIFRAPSLPPLPPPPRLPVIEATPSGTLLPPTPVTAAVELTPQGAVLPIEDVAARPSLAPYPRSRRWLFLSAAFLSGLLVALSVVTLSRLRERPRPVAPLNIRLRLLGMRDDARPVIGGVRYFSNEAYVPRASRPLRIRVEADGFESIEVNVVPDRDRDLVLPPMLPVPAAPAPPVAPPVAAAVPRPAPSAPAPPVEAPARPRVAAPSAAPALPTSVGPGLAQATALPELAVGSTPRCRVLVDGHPVGQTPLFHLRLAAGTHQITCERPNETVSRSVEITPGAPNARVFFDGH
ncbi:MAG: serine/threonine protein kinase [Deltaproteobacteria bacterium]|nr:serine/threonine protein kinase [Deltaproteobacteria bacterium]